MKRTSKWSIGSVVIDGRVGLAPMAGVCDTAYRLLAKEQGASLLCTEMISAMGIKYNNEHTKDLLFIEEGEPPISMQIFGSNPEAIAIAAKAVEEAGADIVDINMGCPVKKVVSSGDGSALMKTPDLAARITEAAVKAVSIPVTVKMRLGWDGDSKNVLTFAKLMEEAGAQAIAVHGRTREEMYSGHADWSYIKAVKEQASIPVLGNGDVVDPISAAKMMEETGCDAVLVGRAAQGNPWIFKQIRAYLEEGILLEEPSFKEKMAMLRRHFALLVKYKSEALAVKEIRTHASWYTKGLPKSAQWRTEFHKATSEKSFYAILEAYEKALGEIPHI